MKLEGYDVIVVGLGGGGMTAYLAAAQGGATVFGIEACAKIGGNSATAGGPMPINPQTKMDSQNGGKKFLEEEDLIADWIDYTRGDAKERARLIGTKESGETVDWLANDFDFKFMDEKPFFHRSSSHRGKLCHRGDGERHGLDLEQAPDVHKAATRRRPSSPKKRLHDRVTATELIVE